MPGNPWSPSPRSWSRSSTPPAHRRGQAFRLRGSHAVETPAPRSRRPAMLPRVLEPEVMDTEAEARDYDAMDHATVNRAFVADLLALWDGRGTALDLGTGTA